ncbi:MAG TPA: alpha-1,4-glucan--maltose-1-phosphate maltosyltransferase [Noviherbaspirillum sp.]|jgi:starch synthase (maltosyl-transferring)|uniref:alpha-1,4-glucan--maltose-1-phosphate maltosyltransferase n=1 Tax=Noviherbaspirillum sp. TaxID=1926288 RepID=UPI002DDD934E|nr:alpha-1,4-glucan--maltose-1-phosphate maltosyltransferase [Noviherbaspirillum sp.]HEV2609851.1 alpha-1,4-glucan--maltose-1-phosphate maltosyltransferase [Noviherbaspirillum sp.]
MEPRLAGSGADLDRHLARCAGMGFDHILIPPQMSDDSIHSLVRACGQSTSKLHLLVDFDPRGLGSDAGLVASHPDWFRAAYPDDDLPDPRHVTRRPAAFVPRYENDGVVAEIAAYWAQRLQALTSAGAAGFRCIGVGEAPAAFWRKLIATVNASGSTVRFLAWTPGCTPAQIDELAGCGFDATFSSGAWWDYRSRWLAEEQARLLRAAPPIAFPDSPDEPVIDRVGGNEDIPVRRQIYKRALRLAAAAGSGILVPMGFEFGASGVMRMGTASGGERQPWSDLQEHRPFDLTGDISEVNRYIAKRGAVFYGQPIRMLSLPEAEAGAAAILLREAVAAGADGQREAVFIVVNPDVSRPCEVDERRLLERAGGFIRAGAAWPLNDDGSAGGSPSGSVHLDSGALELFSARTREPVLLPRERAPDAAVAAKSPRIAIEAVSPSVDGGLFPVKRVVGESVCIEADVFVDGHDKLAVVVLWRAADESEWHETRMHLVSNDRWKATVPMTRMGRHEFAIEAWRDAFSTYRDELEKKTTAGLNVALELEEGRLLVQAAARHAQEKRLGVAPALAALVQTLEAGSGKDADAGQAERIAALLSEPTAEAMRLADARPFAVRTDPPLRIDVERIAARFSSWYELFPRSQSGDPARHGTFADVEKRLPAIQAMGFDTLYFTPIHPIGKKHRKGRNNSLTAGPDDPGSPYAIGSEEGGHDAIHPELGTLEDFRRLRDAAARHGLELALDFAIQCSPDHPWLKEHPDWFTWRPDGTIRYAENPPKKYQDIVNVDFYAKGSVPGLWMALRDAVLFWVKEGVRVFRVDNPHTKPLPFWEWMIADIRGQYPDTIFLSEAFTRPKMMYRLAKVGYSQSYTYFTWRHTKQEFIEYMTELSTTSVREYFRPHFFVNTPDINPYFLQRSGRPGFLIRAALATMLSGLWGMYSGFELCEAAPVPGKEEYLDSEKYEIRAWDWQRPGNIIREITQLNRIRSENPALHTHLNIRFLNASNDNILFFIKSTAPPDDAGDTATMGDNVILGAINLDPFAAHEADLELPLWEFGQPDDGGLEVDDLVNGGRLAWHGKFQRLRLDPFVNPYAIWRVRSKGIST